MKHYRLFGIMTGAGKYVWLVQTKNSVSVNFVHSALDTCESIMIIKNSNVFIYNLLLLLLNVNFLRNGGA